MTKNLKSFINAKNEGKILKGTIKMVYMDTSLGEDVLVLDLQTIKGIIRRSEVDSKLAWKSLLGFIGREVSYKVIEVDEKNGTVYASRKDAQVEMEGEIIQRLQDGEVFNAQVVNIMKYGAFVEIDGVTGLLKNADFAEDYTSIGEVLKVGETVNVKLRKISDSDRLLFEAVKKYKNPTIFSFDMFERDQVVLGVVRNVKPWGIYVCIAPNIDALCPVPGTGEIEEGMKVSFRITQVKPEEKRIRGKILRVLS